MKTFLIIEYTARLLNGSFWYGSLTKKLTKLNEIPVYDRIGCFMKKISMSKALFYEEYYKKEAKRGDPNMNMIRTMSYGRRVRVGIIESFEFLKLDEEEMNNCFGEGYESVENIAMENDGWLLSSVEEMNFKEVNARMWMFLTLACSLLNGLTWFAVSKGKVDISMLYIVNIVNFCVLTLFLNVYVGYIKMVFSVSEWMVRLSEESKKVHSIIMREIPGLRALQDRRDIDLEVKKLKELSDMSGIFEKVSKPKVCAL